MTNDAARIRTDEAKNILQEIGMPKAQQNERSAWSLLALLNLTPEKPWNLAECRSIGITPIMEFIGKYYRHEPYKPNTRETIRRHTMHQFVEAGIAVENPDDPERPINSPDWCYQVSHSALRLFQAFHSPQWKKRLSSFLAKNKTLPEKFAKHRNLPHLELSLDQNIVLKLSQGKHSHLTLEIFRKFRPIYSPDSEILYVGDTGNKKLYYNSRVFEDLKLTLNPHGKFPDIILYDRKRQWLLLIEVVTSHGPISPKRHLELTKLFQSSCAGLVYVTAFPDRQIMKKYLTEISWETEVWIADSPEHLIHFNGEKFLGPYQS